MITITRRIEFSAAHRLHSPELGDEENRRTYGVCNNPKGHGHNYAVEVTVRGEVPKKTGMVLDLKILRDVMQRVIHERCDHKHLNHDVPMLEGVIPTAENLAIRFWEELEPELRPYAGVKLHRVRIIESRDNYVDYHGPDGR